MTKYLIVLFIMLSTLLSAAVNEHYFRFELRDKSALSEITRIISIDNVRGHWVYAYANDEEWDAFQRLGYFTQALPHPGSLYVPEPARSPQQMRNWDTYPTYGTYVSMMNQYAATYPALCQIIDGGNTVLGRKILFARIGSGVNPGMPKPSVLLTASMHGDEPPPFVLLLRLIDTLLSQYGSDPRITHLVDNLDIWINPHANPDGTYRTDDNTLSNPTRGNYNGVDLNRNYPDVNGNQAHAYASQPETTIMKNISLATGFALSANYHTGAQVVNYPWDYQYALHADDAWFISLSRAYATSAQNNSPAGYMTYLNNGITNGAVWYVVDGGRQDWMCYGAKGRETTVEISNTKFPAASTLPNLWNYNYDAMLGYLEFALVGIHGMVTDPLGNPLVAEIKVIGHDNTLSLVQSRAQGDFYRFLQPGVYTLEISAPGYPTRLVENVVVTSGQKTTLNVILGDVPYVQNVSLQSGWNLISMNAAPDDMSVQSVFSDLGTNLLQVKDNALSYAPSMPSHFNTLTALDVCKAYWVKVSSSAILSVQGDRIPVQTPIQLNAGWNLVAYLPETALPVANALISISPYLQEVRDLSTAWQSTRNGNTLTQMEPGKGYWIKVSQGCNLIYP